MNTTLLTRVGPGAGRPSEPSASSPSSAPLARRATGDVAGGSSPRRRRRAARHDLLDDLGGRHVAGQPLLAGGAERAVHAAAGLARDADGDPVRVAHEHRLDEGAVEEPPHLLDRGAAVGGEAAHRGEQGRQQVGDEVVAHGLRAGRSCPPGGRRAARSSGSTAGRRGRPGAPGRRRPPGARRGVRSARWRGGLPRRGRREGQLAGDGSGAGSRHGGRLSQVDRAQPTARTSRQRPGDRRDDDERVEAVHQAAVPGQQRPHVLDAEVALDARLDEVAQGGRAGGDRAEDGARPPGTAEQQRQRDGADDGAGDRPSRRSPPTTSSGSATAPSGGGRTGRRRRTRRCRRRR